jgi:dCMP deaminase
MLKSYPWDDYFMTIAYLVSMKSKDPSTRVGAVIVGQNNEIRSTGYNGLPRLIADREYRYNDRKYKNFAISHAEENAILNSSLNGVSVKDCTIYTPYFPCARCAKAIIQSGIIEVVYDPSFPGNKKLQDEITDDSIKISDELLTEAEIKIREFNGKIIDIVGSYKGEKFDFDKY